MINYWYQSYLFRQYNQSTYRFNELSLLIKRWWWWNLVKHLCQYIMIFKNNISQTDSIHHVIFYIEILSKYTHYYSWWHYFMNNKKKTEKLLFHIFKIVKYAFWINTIHERNRLLWNILFIYVLFFLIIYECYLTSMQLILDHLTNDNVLSIFNTPFVQIETT